LGNFAYCLFLPEGHGGLLGRALFATQQKTFSSRPSRLRLPREIHEMKSEANFTGAVQSLLFLTMQTVASRKHDG
jgi:hypothetical protein